MRGYIFPSHQDTSPIWACFDPSVKFQNPLWPHLSKSLPSPEVAMSNLSEALPLKGSWPPPSCSHPAWWLGAPATAAPRPCSRRCRPAALPSWLPPSGDRRWWPVPPAEDRCWSAAREAAVSSRRRVSYMLHWYGVITVFNALNTHIVTDGPRETTLVSIEFQLKAYKCDD